MRNSDLMSKEGGHGQVSLGDNGKSVCIREFQYSPLVVRSERTLGTSPLHPKPRTEISPIPAWLLAA